MKEALAQQSAGTDCDFGLVHVVTRSGQVLFHSQQHLDARALVVLKHIVE